jgi:hypothetical protein
MSLVSHITLVSISGVVDEGDERVDALREALRSVTAQLKAARAANDDLFVVQTRIMRTLREDHGITFRRIGEDAGITQEGVIRRLR